MRVRCQVWYGGQTATGGRVNCRWFLSPATKLQGPTLKGALMLGWRASVNEPTGSAQAPQPQGNGEAGKSYPRNQTIPSQTKPGRRKTAGLLVGRARAVARGADIPRGRTSCDRLGSHH